jgi:hypothetical protein
LKHVSRILEFYRAWTSVFAQHGHETMCPLIVSPGMRQSLAYGPRVLPMLHVGWKNWGGAERILVSL